MSSDRDVEKSSHGNLFEEMLAQFRSEYVEEHGEDPPDEVMETVRAKLLQGVAREKRAENQDIYDALAKE